MRVNETASPPLSVPWKTMPTPASWGFTGTEFKVAELADALLSEGEGPAAACRAIVGLGGTQGGSPGLRIRF